MGALLVLSRLLRFCDLLEMTEMREFDIRFIMKLWISSEDRCWAACGPSASISVMVESRLSNSEPLAERHLHRESSVRF